MAEKEINQIVRVANVDMNGFKPIYHELTKVTGVGKNFSIAILNVVSIQKKKKAGELSDSEIKRIEEALQDPAKFGIPDWMFNRKKDPETGKDMHVITNDLKFIQDNDIKMMRKIRSYKGIRHSLGQPVRGQKTKSNFRKNKGKVTGVHRSKDAPKKDDAGSKKDSKSK